MREVGQAGNAELIMSGDARLRVVEGRGVTWGSSPYGLGSESRDLRDADSHRRVKVIEGSEERSMEFGEEVVRLLQLFGLMFSRLDS